MKLLSKQRLAEWAHNRQTDVEVAEAIMKISKGNLVTMDHIWEEPTQQQTERVKTILDAQHGSNREKMWWGKS